MNVLNLACLRVNFLHTHTPKNKYINKEEEEEEEEKKTIYRPHLRFACLNSLVVFKMQLQEVS